MLSLYFFLRGLSEKDSKVAGSLTLWWNVRDLGGQTLGASGCHYRRIGR